MKKSDDKHTLQWINEQYSKGNISFKHKLQRPIGQWSPKMKSICQLAGAFVASGLI